MTEHPVPESSGLRCGECGSRPMADMSAGVAACANAQCSSWGMVLRLGVEADRLAAATGTDPCPAGLPRPVLHGRPVPWLTPVTGTVVWWRAVHGPRLQACQNAWLCQVCGTPLHPEATALALGDGTILSSACLHPGTCTDLALRSCPALREREPLPLLVSREDIVADGSPLIGRKPLEGYSATWWLAPATITRLQPRVPADTEDGPATTQKY